MTFTTDPIATSPFGTIEDRHELLNKKSIKDFFRFSTFATLFFIVADFASLNIKWTAVLQDNWYFVALLAAVSAVSLDLPMYLAGKTLREYQDGFKTKKFMILIVSFAVAAFLFAYVPFLLFSMVTKASTFEEALPLAASAGNSFIGTDTATVSNPMSVSIAAIFLAILPLCTSISSLVVGLYTFNPAKERLQKLEEVKNLAQEHKTYLMTGIAQVTERVAILKAREEDLFNNFKNEVYAQEQVRIQAYEEALEETLDADGILRVTDNAFKYLESSGFCDECSPLTADALIDPVIEESKGMTTLTPGANSFNNVA